MSVFGLIASDLSAKAAWVYGDASGRNRLKAFLADGSFAMLTYRFMQSAQRCRLTPLAMIFNKINVVFGGCIIGRGADFGASFVLIHSRGVVINSSVRGGEHVYLEHDVTIGAEKTESPRLGSKVFVGAGARIIGAVSIGDETKIGANAVVTKDVPDGATAVGVPARILGSESAS